MGGLHLLVNPNGSKLWRYACRFEGKQKLLALGAYFEVSLRDGQDASSFGSQGEETVR